MNFSDNKKILKKKASFKEKYPIFYKKKFSQFKT